MTIERIQPRTVKSMFLAGAKYLESKKKYVDELNVFPVPDGDTGTNMTLTILAAAKELNKVDADDMAQVAKAISSGSLRGARGNSGVILSQLFRGFCKEISQYESIDMMNIAVALERGSETAYKAVMKPKEGTILTVARETAVKALEVALETNDIVEGLRRIIQHAEVVLQNTPNLLPVLKEAGVVDSGGQGYVYVLRGALMALEQGDNVTIEFESEDAVGGEMTMTLQQSPEDIKFGYCTEFIINVPNDGESEREAIAMQRYLETIGDSIVAVADEDIIKVHVHTNDPGLALQRALSIGSLSNLKIDNMREEHAHRLMEANTYETKAPTLKEYGFVVISIGEGLSEIFKSLGADAIVEGGQTMNPSTEDILKAVETVHAKRVFILPNNKNIILAAQQAQAIVEDKEIIVIPSTTIPQGINAMINFDPEATGEDNEAQMTEVLDEVKTGQVTYAIRDTSIEDQVIAQGDILGIGEGKIIAVNKEVGEATRLLMADLIDEDSELITVYYGEAISKEEAEAFGEYLKETYSDCDVEIHYGGQPLYYYIMSVE